MNRKTKEEIRRGVEAQASKVRSTWFGALAYAALMRGVEKRKARLKKQFNETIRQVCA
jgi:hypothetical protein